MKTNNTTNTTTRNCDFVKADGNVCRARFRHQDASVTRCHKHREGEKKRPELRVEERALAIPQQRPNEATFRVNLGEVHIGKDMKAEGKILSVITSVIHQLVGLDLHRDAFVNVTIGTRDSAVTMKADAGQFVLMAFPSQKTEVSVEVDGFNHRLRVSAVEEGWGPKIVEEACAACFAAGRVFRLHDGNRWVVKVGILAEEDGLRHSEIKDEDLRITSVCPEHGKAANRIATDAAVAAGKIEEDRRLYVYAPYKGRFGEGDYLKSLEQRRGNLGRAEEEFRKVEGESFATVADAAARLAARRKERK